MAPACSHDHRMTRKVAQENRSLLISRNAKVKGDLGFQAIFGCVATVASTEIARMICKKQILTNTTSPFDTFVAIAT